ncbi:regulatory protein RecX [Candidatus Roizmanbacteria bacterium]|nr:regulatory protein RecX [Candidatus Roizmanbacteria bacterium]
MEQETYDRLLNHAYRLLSRRPQSEQELRMKLHQYGYKRKLDYLQDSIEQVITVLYKQNYLDDATFAEWYVSQRQEFRPRSKRRLSMELSQKGISEDISQKILETYDEEGVLNKLIEKKKNLYSREELIDYLLKQGFPYSLIEDRLSA